VEEREALERLASAPVAVLGTTDNKGHPHLVPITFAIIDGSVVSVVDHKPKSTTRLKRLANIEATRVASVLAHEYSHDWQELWWVRLDGDAEVLPNIAAVPGGKSALAAKYPEYARRAPGGPAVRIAPTKIVSWSFAGQ
jgi:PPOX class probable F420-dependent enzyme